MADTALTAEQILQAAEDVLRRYGPSKATVVDVARMLGVSHGSVYRHFATKAALREAVTQRWLSRAHAGLAEIAAERGPAPDRLYRWISTLHAAKRRKALEDPELFATYRAISGKSGPEHLNRLHEELAAIIADGVAAGEFRAVDPHRAAAAVFDATGRYHNPLHANDWNRPETEEAFGAVCALVLSGLLTAGTELPPPLRQL